MVAAKPRLHPTPEQLLVWRLKAAVKNAHKTYAYHFCSHCYHFVLLFVIDVRPFLSITSLRVSSALLGLGFCCPALSLRVEQP